MMTDFQRTQLWLAYIFHAPASNKGFLSFLYFSKDGTSYLCQFGLEMCAFNMLDILEFIPTLFFAKYDCKCFTHQFSVVLTLSMPKVTNM